MSLYFTVPFLVLIALLQSSLAPRLALGGAHVELMLLVVVSWSLRRGLQEGVVWACCGGLIMDLLSGVPMGTSALALMAAAAASGLARGSLERSQAALPWVMAGASTLIYYAVTASVLAIFGRPIDVGSLLLQHILPSALYNVIVVALVYNLLGWLDQRTREPELRW